MLTYQCDDFFCGFWGVAVLMYIYMLLYPLGIAYMLYVFRKPKFYRSVFIVLLANMTLYTIWHVISTLDVINDMNLLWFALLFFILLYPAAHLIFDFLFNSVLPSFHPEE